MVGVQILTAVTGRPLDDQALRPFWEAAAGLGVPVLIHPFEAAPLVDLVGGDRVTMGTDYPTGMVQAAPLAALEAAGLAPEVHDGVAGENARRIFGLGHGAAGAGKAAGRG